jgi:hypothetical protein
VDEFIVGLDLGQSRDYTALVVLQRIAGAKRAEAQYHLVVGLLGHDGLSSSALDPPPGSTTARSAMRTGPQPQSDRSAVSRAIVSARAL